MSVKEENNVLSSKVYKNEAINGWETVEIGELIKGDIIYKPVDGNHGNIHPTTKDYVQYGIPFLLASDVENDKVDLINCKFISKETAEKLQKGFAKEGDVLLTHKGSVGNTAIVPKLQTEYIILTPQVTYYRIKDNQKLNNRFLKSFFQSNYFQNQLKVFGKGATRAYIGIIAQQKLKILLPKSIKEQEKIALIFSTWDKAIELKEKLIEQKKERKRGLMQKLLTSEVRLSGFDGKWENKRIKSISKVYRGASPRPISDSKWFDQNSKIGWVRISDVTKSRKNLLQTEQYLSQEGVKKSRLIKKGNIIMSICATVGKPIVTGFDVCIHDGFVVFDDLKLNKDYFYYLLLRLENHWTKYGQTGSQMNLNTGIVGNEKVMFPTDLLEQKEIAQVLLSADREINLLKSELESIKQQKEGLMQLLLKGKVRVKV
ncbi:restriction endonuclease subunit S [Bacillus cereus]|nr:restriction endonuclease subunit S [Bacillus cereus]